MPVCGPTGIAACSTAAQTEAEYFMKSEAGPLSPEGEGGPPFIEGLYAKMRSESRRRRGAAEREKCARCSLAFREERSIMGMCRSGSGADI